VARLARSELRFRSYVENARDIVFSFDLEGRLSYVSPNSRDFMDEDSLPVLVDWLEGRVHPDDVPAVRRYFSVPAEASSRHESIEYRIRRLDGSWRWQMSNLSALPGLGNAIEGYMGVARDITELKMSGQKLLEREEQLHRILENLQDSYFQADLAGKFIVVNNTAAAMYGYDSPAEMIGLPASILYANPDDRDALLAMLRPLGHVRDWTCRGRRKDGSAFWVSMNVQFIRNQQGEVLATEGVVRDISERMQTEARIKEALEEKTLLIRELYHRTRNNMQVIMAMMQLQSSFNADTRIATVMDDCVRRVQAMALVHDKLYEARHLTRLSLDEYLMELCQLIMKSLPVPGVDLKLELDQVLVSIDTAVPCGLVVNELLSNALRHAFTGRDSGTIGVSLRTIAGSCLVLEVADNGVGLPPGMDYHNSGTLGLQTIVGIVEHQLQGSIAVDGSAGLRCTVEFTDTVQSDRVSGCS
jgi:PAS domain S-box-containing protein